MGRRNEATNLIELHFMRDSEYIVDLMGAPGTLIPTEIPCIHLESSGNFLLGPETIEQTVKDLCLALDKVSSQFERKTDVLEGSYENSLLSGHLGLQIEETSNLGSRPEDVDAKFDNDRIERCENELGKFCPSPSRRQDSLKPKEVISPSQRMKVNDVSKYVVTAAKNPEFAQKLHAVLLESGASPPPDLFSELSPSLDLIEQDRRKGNYMEREGISGTDLPVSGWTLNFQPLVSHASVAEYSNDTDNGKRNQHVGGESTYNIDKGIFGMSMSTSFVKANEWLVENDVQLDGSFPHDFWSKFTGPGFDTLDVSTATCMKQVNVSSVPYEAEPNIFGSSDARYSQENAGRHSNPYKHGDIPSEDCQECAKNSTVKLLQDDPHGLSASDNIKRSIILDAVAEWEIPWEDLQIGERIGLGMSNN
ncbi:hypothetical protein GW17_00007099 [Ensete ventricosum]|nr:hypothetical protein GW17_00007099 [Ensete ventricosum]